VSGAAEMSDEGPVWRGLLLAVLIVDAVLLATLELFYLPLRLDGLTLPRLGDVPVPVTVLLAAATTPLLVTQAARLGRARVAMLPFVVWFLTLVVLGLFGPGRDRVLLLDWRGLLLLAGGALPAAMVLGGVLGRRSTTTRGLGRDG
jgi:hypothetical protein